MKAQHVLALALVGLVVLIVLMAPPAASAQSGDGARGGDLREGHRADPPAEAASNATGRRRSHRCRSSPTRTSRPWARAIKMRTGLRNQRGAMPPWFVERDLGIQHFKNDPSLSEAEIEKIAIWADSGAPFGNRADLPPPLVFADANEWSIGEPDLILESPAVTVPASAPDKWTSLGTIPTGLTEDRYVAAVEVKEFNDIPPDGTGDTVRRPLRVSPHDLRRGGAGGLGRRVGNALPRPRGGPQRRHLPDEGRPAAPRRVVPGARDGASARGTAARPART